MRHTRHHFLFMILFILFLILGGSFLYQYLNSSKFQNSLITYNQTEQNSCHINIVKPTIVLRMDDVRAYSKQTIPLADEIINRNLSVVLGVIPENLEKDANIKGYLIKVKENPNVEISEHGVKHNEEDINLTEESLLEGYTKIQRLIGLLPITYIPPYNKINLSSMEIVSKYFKVISTKEGILKEGEKIAEIGYTTSTYDYFENKINPTNDVIEECKKSLENTNLCVITIHPQEYASDINNPSDLSKEKFNEFKNMLDKLQELNAKFYTFKDLVVCSN